MKFFCSVICGIILSFTAAYADEMPSFIAGKKFTGVGMQPDGNVWQADFIIAKSIDPKKPSKVINETAGCEANLFAIEVNEKKVVFKERLTKGKNICMDLGYTIIEYDQISQKPILSSSPLRQAQPVTSKAILFEKNEKTPSYEKMKEFTQRFAKVEGSLMGSWAGRKFTTPGGFFKCDKAIPREGNEWVPFNAKGSLALWAVPTEEGGKAFVVYRDPQDYKVLVWRELKHWVGKSFYTDEKVFMMDGRKFFSASDDELVITQQRGGSFLPVEHKYSRCR